MIPLVVLLVLALHQPLVLALHQPLVLVLQPLALQTLALQTLALALQDHQKVHPQYRKETETHEKPN